MTKYIYKIIMNTPLGTRQGIIELDLIENRINGFIRILGSKHALKGELFGNAECVLRGSIVTLVRTIDFIAKGHFDKDGINLELHGQRHIYHISGEICTSTEC